MTVMNKIIGRGQYHNRKYEIWSIFDRQSTLLYWYVIAFADKTETIEGMQHLNKNINKYEIDIRTLPNYKQPAFYDIIRNPQKVITPIIKEAVRKGYIKPV